MDAKITFFYIITQHRTPATTYSGALEPKDYGGNAIETNDADNLVGSNFVRIFAPTKNTEHPR